MKESIVLGGGCFWCIEAAMKIIPGVLFVTPGYAGGSSENPTYEAVCGGQTGHAEVVQIEFDPEIVPLTRLLELFFKAHDPTQVNRQGNDVGTQYRSVIYWTEESQVPVIEAAMEVATKEWSTALATEVAYLSAFYPAEEYHHDYFKKNPTQAYCQFVVRPKVEKVREALQ